MARGDVTRHVLDRSDQAEPRYEETAPRGAGAALVSAAGFLAAVALTWIAIRR